MEIILNNGETVTATVVEVKNGVRTPVPDEEIPGEILENIKGLNLMACELCTEVHDCRPFGPKGEQICPPCGLKDTVSTYLAAKAYGGESYAENIVATLAAISEFTEKPDLSKMN